MVASALRLAVQRASAKKQATSPDAFRRADRSRSRRQRTSGQWRDLSARQLCAAHLGQQGGAVGDMLTIVLVERTAASEEQLASTERSGDIGLSPRRLRGR